ncbi:hypothetical protein GS18_0220220 [Metabacillus indicus]|uniref:Uncharacterized protein n=1 Tax=Metabacillus indicus TaxID=246786 RepID=A0A084GIL5_METID|nr:hypothetical protein GS18_0220220 [Metabacillus indicus]
MKLRSSAYSNLKKSLNVLKLRGLGTFFQGTRTPKPRENFGIHTKKNELRLVLNWKNNLNFLNYIIF